jgi:hypothetical protein
MYKFVEHATICDTMHKIDNSTDKKRYINKIRLFELFIRCRFLFQNKILEV